MSLNMPESDNNNNNANTTTNTQTIRVKNQEDLAQLAERVARRVWELWREETKRERERQPRR
jgi:hypothetical protein